MQTMAQDIISPGENDVLPLDQSEKCPPSPAADERGRPKNALVPDFHDFQKKSGVFERKICGNKKGSYFCHPLNAGNKFFERFLFGIKKPL